MTSPDGLPASYYSPTQPGSVGEWDLDIDLIGLGDELLFGPIRQLLSSLTGLPLSTWPTIPDIVDGAKNILGAIGKGIEQLLSGVIPIGLLSRTTPNLLANGGFDGAVSIVEGEGWSWDELVGRTSPGSARFDANGAEGIQLSTPVQVAEGQDLTCEGWTKWAGVTATAGSGFRIARRWYDATTLVSTEVIAGVVDPSASGGWVRLSDAATTPAGVDSVCLELRVDAGVSVGQIWFDDMALTKPATSLPQQWISGLVDTLGDLGTDVAAALAWIKDLIEKLTGRAWATITDAIAGVQTFASQLKTILSGGIVSTPLPSLIGSTIREARTMIEQIAGIAAGNPITPINGVVQAFKDGWSNTTGWIQDLIDAVLRAVRRVPVVGGTLADIISEVGGLNDRADAAQSTADGVQNQVSTGLGGQMITTGVLDTMEYHLLSFTSSGTWTPAAHTVPTGFEIDHYLVTVYGGGDGGARGLGGGPGGRNGGRIVRRVLPADAGASRAVTVGAGGAGATSDGFGGTGGSSSFGGLVASVPGASAIPTPMGDIASSAQPGDGGDGGRAIIYAVGSSTGSSTGGETFPHTHTVSANNTNEPGRNGASSSSAAGGRGGRGASGWWGSADAAGTGANGTTQGSYTTGGGGGGGGGAASSGQAGANGGAPGGGGGGGGSKSSPNIGTNSGNGGSGARGQVDVCAMFRPVTP